MQVFVGEEHMHQMKTKCKKKKKYLGEKMCLWWKGVDNKQNDITELEGDVGRPSRLWL